ncbi:MAG: trypsin-like peptidase domain-containing protein [Cryobacterium sp.]|nr:trypsin-like peptidase domain-containing protein [Oligoflexia bacterium]
MKLTPGLVSIALTVFSYSFTSAFADDPKPKVIYGKDDRLDLFAVTNSRDLALADSTVALISVNGLKPTATGFDIAGDPFGAAYSLCQTERFFEQPTGASCSGSLVGEDLVITAGHCIPDAESCETTKFVFGYGVKEDGVFPTSARSDDVVGCKEIVDRKQIGDGADYAVIRLDRKIENHRPLSINRGADVKNGDKIGVIGHPCGLPTKVAFGESEVRDATPNGFFRANLDTYGGNSGSAVFNTKTGLIEGILVRGENDFVEKDGCRVSHLCAPTGCRGEDVTKISALAHLIPDNPLPPVPPRKPPSSRWPLAASLKR